MMRVNLIPARRLIARRRRTLTQRWIIACVLLAIALGATWAGMAAIAGNNRQTVAEQIAEVETEVAETTKEINQIKATQQRVRMHLDANRQVTNLPDWSLLMAMLAGQMGDEIVLNDCALSPRTAAAAGAAKVGATNIDTAKPAGFVVTVTGLGRTQPSVTQFVLRLERMGIFAKVQLIDTRREPFLQDQAVAFRIVCTIELESEVAS